MRQEKKKDGRLQRAWFPSDKKRLEESSWDDIKTAPHILLVRAPLTFGHSQLVIPEREKDAKNKDKGKLEAKLFKEAAKLIAKAIEAFHKVLRQEAILSEFSDLAGSTRTGGKLIKILVLRSSASENPENGGYKVHLVPYFDSHAGECLERFRSGHEVRFDKKGGLLGWLGSREDEVDKFEVEYLEKYKNDIVEEKWLNLPDLAKKLRAKW